MTDPLLQSLITSARHRITTLRDAVRDREGQRERDKGALSIELALLVGALVVIAAVIVGILVAKVHEKGNSIG